MLNYLLFLSMVHEYAYFYEYIWKPVYLTCYFILTVLQLMQLSCSYCNGNFHQFLLKTTTIMDIFMEIKY